MQYNNLKLTKQTAKNRVGRGIAAGQGKTAGRGTKGQNARKSGGVRPGFEGGQSPLMQRLPKLRGFTSHRPVTATIYTGQLATVKAAKIDNQALFEAGIITSPFGRVKVVLNGELNVKKDIHLQAASKTAAAAIKKAGGSFTVVARPQQAKTAAPKSEKRTKKTK